jgi:hypothetical protein
MGLAKLLDCHMRARLIPICWGFGLLALFPPVEAQQEASSLESLLQSLEILGADTENRDRILEWVRAAEEIRRVDREIETVREEMTRLSQLRESLENRFAATQTAVAVPGSSSTPVETTSFSTEDLEFFETHIRPALVENCLSCHGPEKTQGGLRLDTSESLLRGGDSGAVILPGDPEGSPLLKAIEYLDPSLQMPPSGKLPDSTVDNFREWIRRGAPSPSEEVPTVQHEELDLAEARRFWSFQPLADSGPPTVSDPDWVANPIDFFVLDRLQKEGLSPAAPADKRVLLRRVTFDLTGLPPTPEEVEKFLADESPEAYESLIDRLLASPAYGERWGRHWLDVVRYTDSFDSRAAIEQDVGESYRYRDWVVRSFNRDLPYDEFLRYQIAGDLLPPEEEGGEGTPGFNREGVIATGMLAIGNWPGGDADKEKMVTDIVDDQIDVISRGMLGLTVACARCHDHKFDPVTTEDYYGLAGIFFSSHILPGPGRKTEGSPVLRIPLLSEAELEQRRQTEARVATVKGELESLRAGLRRTEALASLPSVPAYLIAARELRDSLSSDTGHQGDTSPHVPLSEKAIRGWMRYLGFEKERPLSREVVGIHEKPALHAWLGAGDATALTLNTSPEEISYLTIIQPGESAAVHPSPSNPVMVDWTCPEAGVYQVEGEVRDLDSTCGDGVDWRLSLENDSGTKVLCQGGFINGGKELFSNAAGSDVLAMLSLSAGDRVRITVSPKSSHACDTTLVDLSIRSATDPGGDWNLARDLLRRTQESVASSDNVGGIGPWILLESTEKGGAGKGGEAVLGKWEEETGRILLKEGPSISSSQAIEQAANTLGEALIAHAALDATGQMAAADQPIGLLFQDLLSANSPFPHRFDPDRLEQDSRDRWEDLSAELADLESRPLPPLEYANGIQEGGVPETPLAGIQDVPVHIRGRYDRLGEMVPRRFPVVLAGENQPPIADGSGRLELARWVSSSSNPLTARVLVNRVWQHHFGEGLVRTPGNFGKLGERPTHPELLDWLARDFIRQGWSIKALHRRILLSATYRQTSTPSSESLETDPDNRWLSHQNRRRLEAEAIRDAILSVAGRLDSSLGGPPFRDLSTPRRTLYFKTVRSDRTSFNMLFDAADPTAIVDRRTVSTVAPQALFLLNHPFVLENAEILAKAFSEEGSEDRAALIGRLYERLYSRLPMETEIEIGQAFLDSKQASPLEIWTRYCQVLLCANEFIYVD